MCNVLSFNRELRILSLFQRAVAQKNILFISPSKQRELYFLITLEFQPLSLQSSFCILQLVCTLLQVCMCSFSITLTSFLIPFAVCNSWYQKQKAYFSRAQRRKFNPLRLHIIIDMYSGSIPWEVRESNKDCLGRPEMNEC